MQNTKNLVFFILLTSLVFLSSCAETGKATLKGTITYVDGTPIQTHLCITSQENQRLCLLTDANGNFSFADIPALRYSIFIENYRNILFYRPDSYMRAGQPSYIGLKKDTTKVLNLKVENGKNISGSVVNKDASPVSEFRNFKVYLFDKTKNSGVASAITRSGKFEFKNAPVGDYLLFFLDYNNTIFYLNDSESTNEEAKAKTINLIQNKSNLKLFLNTGQSLKINILDFNNVQINDNLQVYLFKKVGKLFLPIETYKKQGQLNNFFTAKAGKIDFKNLPTGEYKFCAVKYNLEIDCFKSASTAVALKDAELIKIENSAKTLNMKLSKGKNLTGALVDKSSNPIEKIHEIYLYNADTKEQISTEITQRDGSTKKVKITAYTDADGKFSFVNLPDGNYKISLRDYLTEKFYKTDSTTVDKLENATPINITATDTSKVHKILQIDKGYKIKGKFYLYDKPLAGREVFLGKKLADGNLEATGIYTDKNGDFEFENIPQGEHLLFIRHLNQSYFYRENSNATNNASQATKININSADVNNLSFKFFF